MSSKKSPARALQTIFDTFDQSQHLFHKLHKSFLHFSCIYTFLEINIIWQTCCIFLPSSVLKWLYKNSPILCFFSHILFYLFFYWRMIALQNLLFSVKPQHESAIGILYPLPFERWTLFKGFLMLDFNFGNKPCINAAIMREARPCCFSSFFPLFTLEDSNPF